MTAPRPVEFWFEFASTYSYPAAMAVEAACAGRGIPLIWRPFLLGPVFAAQGLTDSPFNLNSSKGDYMWRDLERICAAQRLTWRRPSRFPRGSVLAARIAISHNDPWIADFIRAVYTANFGEDRDIAASETIADILVALDMDPKPVIEQAQTPETKAALRAQTDTALQLGLFGAPSFTVGDELFWGHDRLDDALDWAMSSS